MGSFACPTISQRCEIPPKRKKYQLLLKFECISEDEAGGTYEL